jgi:hypothetical protein
VIFIKFSFRSVDLLKSNLIMLKMYNSIVKNCDLNLVLD